MRTYAIVRVRPAMGLKNRLAKVRSAWVNPRLTNDRLRFVSMRLTKTRSTSITRRLLQDRFR